MAGVRSGGRSVGPSPPPVGSDAPPSGDVVSGLSWILGHPAGGAGAPSHPGRIGVGCRTPNRGSARDQLQNGPQDVLPRTARIKNIGTNNTSDTKTAPRARPAWQPLPPAAFLSSPFKTHLRRRLSSDPHQLIDFKMMRDASGEEEEADP